MMRTRTITICGSMSFYDEMMTLKDTLVNDGIKVLTPIKTENTTDYSFMTEDEQSSSKQRFMDEHIDKIKRSDAILVANFEKNGIESYIGANSFIEMAFAYLLKKKIYILNSIPHQSNRVEILGMKPILLLGDIKQLS